MLTHETATFRAQDGWAWTFDVTFMLSNYRCIWGQGCPDITNQHTERGCCPEGVEIYEGEGDTRGLQDLEKIRGRVAQLTDEDWQNRQLVLARGGTDPWGKARFARDSVHTRLHRGACVFANRADHPAGAGCAFHVAALRRGENPMDWKPDTCWRTPIFTDHDDDAKTVTIRPTTIVDWGEEGILDWWCTGHPDAFSGEQPVYLSMEEELRRICGDAVYEEMAAYCAQRSGGQARRGLTLLPMAS